MKVKIVNLENSLHLKSLLLDKLNLAPLHVRKHALRNNSQRKTQHIAKKVLVRNRK